MLLLQKDTKDKTSIVVEMSMLAVVAATLMCTSNGTRRGVQLDAEEEDPFLDEEVGDQLDEEGGQDQLQVLLQPVQLRLLRLNPDLLLPGDKRGNFKFF